MDPVIHIHGGASLLARLEAAELPGERLEWCDPVAFGPTPRGLSDDDWYRLRAAYLGTGTHAPRAPSIEAGLQAQDAALRAIPPATEIVIWVGPELFCQAILIRLLVLLDDRPGVSLVDAGDNPASPGCGLGAWKPAELHALFARRRPVTPDIFAFARQAWEAFTAPTAQPLVALLRVLAPPLAHAAAALARHLDDLPDGASGLSTSETHLLEELRRGPAQPPALLRALALRERRPFLTDSALDEILHRLADAAAPLVARDAAGLASITRRGQNVLDGFDVWFAARWHGGIEVTPDESDVAPGQPTDEPDATS